MYCISDAKKLGNLSKSLPEVDLDVISAVSCELRVAIKQKSNEYI